MAFALPSFNAAVASANTSGAPLQRLQANIDFDDVKSDIATKYMTKLPLEKYLTEASIAKDALAQYGAALRNKMTLDHNMKISEMEVARDKRNALVDLLMGDDSSLGMQLGAMVDPQTSFERELNFRGNKRVGEANAMGVLNPQDAYIAALKGLDKVKVPGQGAVTTAIKQGDPAPQPVTIQLAAPSPSLDLFKKALIQQEQLRQSQK